MGVIYGFQNFLRMKNSVVNSSSIQYLLDFEIAPMTSPSPQSFRKLIHDLNQVVFLARGHCDLANITDNPDAIKGHLRQVERSLSEFESIAERLKDKQLELAPNE